MRMNIRGNDNFQTPQHLFDQLDKIFKFTVDAACCTFDCKCKRGFFFDRNYNGLEESWENERVFCNPPFSKKNEWIKKAYQEVMYGECPICVMILPTNCMESETFQKYIYPNYFFEILKGRVSFIDPETDKPKSGNNSGTVIVYFKKRIERN